MLGQGIKQFSGLGFLMTPLSLFSNQCVFGYALSVGYNVVLLAFVLAMCRTSVVP